MRAGCTQHHGLHSFHPVRNTSLPLPSVALEHARTHTHCPFMLCTRGASAIPSGHSGCLLYTRTVPDAPPEPWTRAYASTQMT